MHAERPFDACSVLSQQHRPSVLSRRKRETGSDTLHTDNTPWGRCRCRQARVLLTAHKGRELWGGRARPIAVHLLPYEAHTLNPTLNTAGVGRVLTHTQADDTETYTRRTHRPTIAYAHTHTPRGRCGRRQAFFRALLTAHKGSELWGGRARPILAHLLVHDAHTLSPVPNTADVGSFLLSFPFAPGFLRNDRRPPLYVCFVRFVFVCAHKDQNMTTVRRYPSTSLRTHAHEHTHTHTHTMQAQSTHAHTSPSIHPPTPTYPNTHTCTHTHLGLLPAPKSTLTNPYAACLFSRTPPSSCTSLNGL